MQGHEGLARGKTSAIPRTARPTRLHDHWRVRWLDHLGQRQSAVFDSYKEADRQLRLLQTEVDEVKRGLRAPPAPEKKTVGDALDYWHDESIIRCHLRPAFGDLSLRVVGVEHVDPFVAARAHLDPKTINNHLTLLILMLNVAVDLGWLLKVPRMKKPKVRAFSADFRYLRTNDERGRFLRAAMDAGQDVYALYATAVFTGMRAGELGGLRWEDVSSGA